MASCKSNQSSSTSHAGMWKQWSLETFAYIPPSVPGHVDENTKARFMTCISRTVHGLREQKTHLKGLDQSIIVLLQRTVTEMCLSIYDNCLREIGVDSLPLTLPTCDCIGHGSNRTPSSANDFIIAWSGKAAMNRFAEYGQLFLEENSQRRVRGDKNLGDILKRHEVVQVCSQRALGDLQHGEELVIYGSTYKRISTRFYVALCRNNAARLLSRRWTCSHQIRALLLFTIIKSACI